MSEQSLVYPVESRLDPCAICLGKCENQSFPKSCLHGFCFSCLLQWSKMKPECPLCVKPFSSVIHNIKSNNEYDEFNIDLVGQEEILSSELSESADDDDSSNTASSDSSWYTIGSDDESNSDDESSSDESSSESDLFGLDDIFSWEPVLSEQVQQRLDASLLSRHSDLAPSANRSGLDSLVIDEEPNIDDLIELSVIELPFFCELLYRWLQGAPSSDEDNGIKDTETALRCIRKGKSPSCE
ncbi:Uncharacterized protein APZ42_030856 [Daphnia magna]|uniref:E3 ubiquitin-protein ligase Topors n=1 Tax=Daphnia magna TaxID=35525 RepID=A0A164NDQ5_9CRUS|nr:Uncharacterized protein APZ42_030856 [Daphnia magna]